MFRSGFTTLIIFNEEQEDIIKIVKSLEESGLLIKRVGETIENEGKEQKGGFRRMLLGTLRDSLFGNLLTGKETVGTGEETLRAGLANLEIQKYENKPKFNDVYSRNNLFKIRDGTYINLHGHESIGTHWIA